MTYDAADEKQISTKRDKQKADEKINELILITTMKTREGRRWVWLQLEGGNIFTQLVDTGPSGHAVMCFAEGRRAGALALLVQVMKLCPQEFVNMLTENSKGLPDA